MDGWVDGHLDMAYLGLMGRNLAEPVQAHIDGCLSLPDLAEAPIACALGTIFTEVGAKNREAPWGYDSHQDRNGAHEAGLNQLRYYQALENDGLIHIVRDHSALLRDAPGLAVVLLMECADPIRSPAEVDFWFDNGVRVVSLAWSHGSRYAGGNAQTHGLTDEGHQLVQALDQAGILHDVSHLSDAAFDDLAACTDQRLIASHSNARTLTGGSGLSGQRHLSDAQLKIIAARDGIVGINLYDSFLSPGGGSGVREVLEHIDYIGNIVGRQRVGLGSDMDGGFGASELPAGLQHPRHLHRILEGLDAMGYSASEQQGFQCGNWLRLLNQVLLDP